MHVGHLAYERTRNCHTFCVERRLLLQKPGRKVSCRIVPCGKCRNKDRPSRPAWNKNKGRKPRFLLSCDMAPGVKYELDLQSLWAPCAQLAETPQPPPSPYPRIWAHMRGRYWSAMIDDISLWPLYDTNPSTS